MPSLLAPNILFPSVVLPKTVAFLVDDNGGSPDTRDSEVKTLLEANGWTVDYLDDGDVTGPSDLDGYGVLLIGHSVVESAVSDKDFALGLDIGIVWVGRRLDTDHGIENLDAPTSAEDDLYFVDVSHPITSFLGSAGLHKVFQSGTVLTAYDDGLSGDPGGTILAREDTGSGLAVFWVYEKGDTRPTGGGTFAGRRVITWIQGQGGQRLDCSSCSYRGETLLLNCLDWVTYRK